MNTGNKIRHIIFDLSDVLITGIKDTGVALQEKHNILLNPGHRLDSHKAIGTPLLVPLVRELFHGNVSEDEYVRGVIAAYPQVGTEAELKRLIRENFREIEGVRDILLELKRLRYMLALLSVHAREWVDYCEKKFDYHKLFDVRVYSYESKVSKPDPAAFQGILAELGTTPDTCLFVDDSKTNVKAAETLGMSGIVFTNAKDLRAKLKKILPDFT